ncbi:FkbM family methyltransferase [Asticcacaulis sp.]|uniref:FkbM family methyltransferase n=1 Tax=Asticcacaulis sp. TaxID=1872648 RepID=UPI002601A387|nr:FkbM family methyltransferase [Asticcacaulis sp.]
MIVWLASYPRSGNTMTRTLLSRVFEIQTYSEYNDRYDIGSTPEIAESVGHVSYDGTWQDFYQMASASPDLFVVKTHGLPTDDQPAIYIVRDGRAAIVSQITYDRTLFNIDRGYANLINGKAIGGPWSDHIERWNPLARDRTLFLRFEDLIHRPDHVIDLLSQFLGRRPLHAWNNPLDQQRQLLPGFFNKGHDTSNLQAWPPADLDYFWARHGTWMERLGYGTGLERQPSDPPLAPPPSQIVGGPILRSSVTPPARETYTFSNGIRLYRDTMLDQQIERYGQPGNPNLHEPDEEHWFTTLLAECRPTAVFADVGAGVGYYSLLAHRLCPTSRLVALEPLPAHAQAIRDHLHLNGIPADRLSLIEEAVAPSAGEASFYAAHYGSHLAQPGATASFPSIAVRCLTLNDLVDRIGSTIDLMKVDIQGLEAEILRSAPDLLAAGKVSRFIIGTYGQGLHRSVRDLIAPWYDIRHDDPTPPFQPDGLIVAQHKGLSSR